MYKYDSKAFQNYSQEIKNEKRWVVWRLEKKPNESKPTKTPYCVPESREDITANGGKPNKASKTDPSDWTTFERAANGCRQFGFDGIGFVLGDGWAGLDIDSYSPETHGWMLDLLDSYTEYSPSGKGIHCIFKGKLPHQFAKTTKQWGKVELYDCQHLTMTGNVLRDRPIAERQQAIDKLFQELEPVQVVARNEAGMSLDDNRITELASFAANGDKFKKLWAGDWSGYHSQSEADLALCCILAFYTRDEEQLARLIGQSGLNRDKWEREDYRRDTISKALAVVTKKYEAELALPSEEGIIQPAPDNLDGLPEAESPFYSWDEYVTKFASEPPRYIVCDALPAVGLTLLSGESYAGKTTLLDYLIACIVQGKPFFGYATQPLPIYYYDYDWCNEERIERLSRFVDDKELLRKWFHPADIEKCPRPLTASFVKKHIKEPSLINIDVLRSALMTDAEMGSENDGSVMTNKLIPFRDVAMQTKSAMLVLHHNNRGKNTFAGSGAIPGVTKALWNYIRDEHSTVGNLSVKTRRKQFKLLTEYAGETFDVFTAEDNLTPFIDQFPTTVDTAITVKDACNLPWVQAKGWEKTTVENKIKDGERLAIAPRLEKIGKGVKGEAFRYFRV